MTGKTINIQWKSPGFVNNIIGLFETTWKVSIAAPVYTRMNVYFIMHLWERDSMHDWWNISVIVLSLVIGAFYGARYVKNLSCRSVFPNSFETKPATLEQHWSDIQTKLEIFFFTALLHQTVPKRSLITSNILFNIHFGSTIVAALHLELIFHTGSRFLSSRIDNRLSFF